MSLCAVVPVYNHAQAIGGVVVGILAADLPCLLVDDGSEPACAAVLDQLVVAYPGRVSLLRLPANQGKGAAVMAGLRHAARQGYGHVLQIDADGQHAVEDIPRFVQASHTAPAAVINGCPVYDKTVPRARLIGRYATHIWVWINTLSFAIRDSMCGFRVYPLAETLALLDAQRIGTGMDFDTEILVRLYWQGLDVFNLPTRVRYPVDGVSHFRLWVDNLRISAMHARLFFGMLPQVVRLLARSRLHARMVR